MAGGDPLFCRPRAFDVAIEQSDVVVGFDINPVTATEVFFHEFGDVPCIADHAEFGF